VNQTLLLALILLASVVGASYLQITKVGVRFIVLFSAGLIVVAIVLSLFDATSWSESWVQATYFLLFIAVVGEAVGAVQQRFSSKLAIRRRSGSRQPPRG
jgi:uncharacterized transporter YbjL